jgi:hypothetical protein
MPVRGVLQVRHVVKDLALRQAANVHAARAVARWPVVMVALHLLDGCHTMALRQAMDIRSVE